MDDGCLFQVIVDISCLFYPIAEIDIFCVHKKALVKATGLFQYGLRHPETGAGKYGRRTRSVGWQVSEIICGKEPPPGKKCRQTRQLAKGYPRRWETAAGLF